MVPDPTAIGMDTPGPSTESSSSTRSQVAWISLPLS